MDDDLQNARSYVPPPLRREPSIRNPRDLRWARLRGHPNQPGEGLSFKLTPRDESNQFGGPPEEDFGGGFPRAEDHDLQTDDLASLELKLADDDPLKLLGLSEKEIDSLLGATSLGSLVSPAPATAAVPASAEQLLLLLYPPERLEAVAGCMEEMFHITGAKHGYGYARWWYWWQLAGHTVERLLGFGERVSKMVSPFKGG